MLNDAEMELCKSLSATTLFDDMKNLSQFNRLSGSDGEKDAVNFLKERLTKAGIEWKLHSYPALLSNPQRAELLCKYSQKEEIVPCKTWSFTSSTPKEGIEAYLQFVEKDLLEHHPLTFLADYTANNKDFQNVIVVSRTSNPVAIMEAERRGAVAFISVWEQGDESIVHEGNVNMIWGTPEPEQNHIYPHIPVVILCRPTGEKLIANIKKDRVLGKITTQVQEGITTIPVLEALIPAEEENGNYLLVGNHLDSWHYGSADNATGNAIALNLAEKTIKMTGKKFGLKICWWSGHSNGRYAGSSTYASRNFLDLERNCLAYTNIDMPGMRGATDFSRISAGPDLMEIASQTIHDITGQKGEWNHHVRGWDQSFQNIGISPYFIWSSTLPENNQDTTANSFMSWWWHTEEDLPIYVSRDILEKDAQLYLTAASRVLCNQSFSFNIRALIQQIKKCFATPLFSSHLTSIKEITEMLEDIERVDTTKLSLQKQLFYVRQLNKILYAFKAPMLQDWAISLEYIPGLSLAFSSLPQTARGKLIIDRFAETQKNRILLLLEKIKNCG